MTEELDKKIREIANYYVSECWGTYLDLSDVDLVQAGIGVALAVTKELQEENEQLKNKIVLSVDCDKAEKHGELCLGYGGDEDEPCEQCKNCIKCETGYYQLGETEKDEQFNKLKKQIEKMKCCFNCKHSRTEYEHCKTNKHEKWEIKE